MKIYQHLKETLPTPNFWLDSRQLLKIENDYTNYSDYEEFLSGDDKEYFYNIKHKGELFRLEMREFEKRFLQFEKDDSIGYRWWFKGQEKIFKDFYNKTK